MTANAPLARLFPQNSPVRLTLVRRNHFDNQSVNGERTEMRLTRMFRHGSPMACCSRPWTGNWWRSMRDPENASGQHGWRGLAVVQWRELGLTKDAIPAEISAQIQRDSAADRYLWSPPLGSAWDHGKQGLGRLRFVKPPASSLRP